VRLVSANLEISQIDIKGKKSKQLKAYDCSFSISSKLKELVAQTILNSTTISLTS
jgi:hypothetical protein